MENRVKRYVYLLLALILAGCIAVLFPQVRQLIIHLAEQFIVHRPLQDHDKWMRAMLRVSSMVIVLGLFLGYNLVVGKISIQILKSFIADAKSCLAEINLRSIVKPILFLSVIYYIGISSIIRANFLYFDDMLRAVLGYRYTGQFSRYVEDFLSIFVHTAIHIGDISPLTQLLSVIIMAVSSVLIIIILNKRVTITSLIACIPIGLSPYFLQCVSFKFDAPYMALSALLCIVPFLFTKSKVIFFVSSFISLLIMCMTYQAFSGVYIVLVIIICFYAWNTKEKPYKEIAAFAGIALFSFCFSMLFFKLFIMEDYAIIGESTAMFSWRELIPGVLRNIIMFMVMVNNDFGTTWKIFFLLICVFFIVQNMRTSKHKKLVSAVVSILVVLAMFVMSYGAFLVLEETPLAPRQLSSVGVFLGIISVCVVSSGKKINILCVFALSWCLFVFAFYYGNALADQKRNDLFRTTILVHDLNNLFPNRDDDEMVVQNDNTMGYTPTMNSIAIHYPVIKRLVPQMEYLWIPYSWALYYNWGKLELVNLKPLLAKNDTWDDFNDLNLPVLFDSYYHTIKSDGKNILVVLKH